MTGNVAKITSAARPIGPGGAPLGTCKQNRRDTSTRIEGPRYALVEHFSPARKRVKLSATGNGRAWSGYLARDKGKGGLDLPSPSGLAEPSFLSIA